MSRLNLQQACSLLSTRDDCRVVVMGTLTSEVYDFHECPLFYFWPQVDNIAPSLKIDGRRIYIVAIICQGSFQRPCEEDWLRRLQLDQSPAPFVGRTESCAEVRRALTTFKHWACPKLLEGPCLSTREWVIETPSRSQTSLPKKVVPLSRPIQNIHKEDKNVAESSVTSTDRYESNAAFVRGEANFEALNSETEIKRLTHLALQQGYTFNRGTIAFNFYTERNKYSETKRVADLQAKSAQPLKTYPDCDAFVRDEGDLEAKKPEVEISRLLEMAEDQQWWDYDRNAISTAFYKQREEQKTLQETSVSGDQAGSSKSDNGSQKASLPKLDFRTKKLTLADFIRKEGRFEANTHFQNEISRLVDLIKERELGFNPNSVPSTYHYIRRGREQTLVEEPGTQNQKSQGINKDQPEPAGLSESRMPSSNGHHSPEAAEATLPRIPASDSTVVDNDVLKRILTLLIGLEEIMNIKVPALEAEIARLRPFEEHCLRGAALLHQ